MPNQRLDEARALPVTFMRAAEIISHRFGDSLSVIEGGRGRCSQLEMAEGVTELLSAAELVGSNRDAIGPGLHPRALGERASVKQGLPNELSMR